MKKIVLLTAVFWALPLIVGNLVPGVVSMGESVQAAQEADRKTRKVFSQPYWYRQVTANGVPSLGG